MVVLASVKDLHSPFAWQSHYCMIWRQSRSVLGGAVKLSSSYLGLWTWFVRWIREHAIEGCNEEMEQGQGLAGFPI